MSDPQNDTLPIIGKRFSVHYKNQYDQVDVFEGQLVHTDVNGCFVFNANEEIMVLPKERIFVMRESKAKP